MNRTVLIVICDFLLLMLLASARLDQLPTLNMAPSNAMQMQEYNSAAPAPAPKANARNARTADLLDSMKSSLEEERTSREQLASTLSQTADALRLQQQLAAQREEQLNRTQASLQAKEEEARRLEDARRALAANLELSQTNLTRIQRQLETSSLEARLSQERLSSVEQQYTSAQSNLVNLEKQLSSSSTEARLARERLAQIEADLRSRQTEAELARQRIEEVEKSRQTAEIEKERIAGKLKVAETETRMTQQQLQAAKGQIETVQKEKAEVQKIASNLSEGVVQLGEKQGELAQKQGELVKEIRDNRPLTANSIYADFLSNRVHTAFRANRNGLLGRSIHRDSEAKTVLLTDGTQTFALYHVDDTPFRIEEFGKDWERFFVHLYHGMVVVPLEKILFLSMDPRVVVAPVSEEQSKKLGVKVYKIASDPLKFQDALVVGADESYYGECRFRVDAANPSYLKMDRSALGRLVGKFNPSRGDLVFAKSGEVVGVMVNKQYCALLTSFVPTTTIPTGANLNSETIGARLSAMEREVRALPVEMQ